jgi:hypothetical protein
MTSRPPRFEHARDLGQDAQRIGPEIKRLNAEQCQKI